MKTLANRIALMAAGTLVVATVASGQTSMTAQIPFEFHAGMSKFPAGEYTVGHLDYRFSSLLATLERKKTHSTVILPGGLKNEEKPGNASLSFQCSGDAGCFLTGIRTSTRSIVYRAPKTYLHGKQVAVVTVPMRSVNAD